MVRTLQEIMERALERLALQATTYLPPLLVALTIVVIAYAVARILRWGIDRLFRGVALDRFLNESGVLSLLSRSGPMKSGPLVASAAYWVVLVVGLLTAVNVFDTKLTTQIVEGTVLLFPKLIIAGAILLAGFWLAQYLGRSVLVWACNERLPAPRQWAAVVRVGVIWVSVVVAADVLDFARAVFLTAFIIGAGGAVLALSLAFGLSGRDALRQYWLAKREQPEGEKEERSLWSHL